MGFPGVSDAAAFVRYMKACQLTTTFYFAATNDKTVYQTLEALQTQRWVSDFVAQHQGVDAGTLQREFGVFLERLRETPVPKPGSTAVAREIKTGGRNE